MTDHSEALDSQAAQVTTPTGGRYHQQLSRSIGILGNVFITLSGVAPASSVFIIVPVALVAAGSGSFLAFVFAAIVGIFMAFCWAELSAAYPIAGGDYALVWHSFKGRVSGCSCRRLRANQDPGWPRGSGLQ
jgi:amino acid transporter